MTKSVLWEKEPEGWSSDAKSYILNVHHSSIEVKEKTLDIVGRDLKKITLLRKHLEIKITSERLLRFSVWHKKQGAFKGWRIDARIIGKNSKQLPNTYLSGDIENLPFFGENDILLLEKNWIFAKQGGDRRYDFSLIDKHYEKFKKLNKVNREVLAKNKKLLEEEFAHYDVNRKLLLSLIPKLEKQSKKRDKNFCEPLDEDWVLEKWYDMTWEIDEQKYEKFMEHVRYGDYIRNLVVKSGEDMDKEFQKTFKTSYSHYNHDKRYLKYQTRILKRRFKVKCPFCQGDWVQVYRRRFDINIWGMDESVFPEAHTSSRFCDKCDAQLIEELHKKMQFRKEANAETKNDEVDSLLSWGIARYFKHLTIETRRTVRIAAGKKENVSRPEKELRRIIRELYPTEEVCFNIRTELDGYELDIYLPRLRLALEYDGIQHFRFIRYWHKTKSRFKHNVDLDKQKKKLCNQKGIALVNVRYDEPLTKEYVKQKIKAGFSRRG